MSNYGYSIILAAFAFYAPAYLLMRRLAGKQPANVWLALSMIGATALAGLAP